MKRRGVPARGPVSHYIRPLTLSVSDIVDLHRTLDEHPREVWVRLDAARGRLYPAVARVPGGGGHSIAELRSQAVGYFRRDVSIHDLVDFIIDEAEAMCRLYLCELRVQGVHGRIVDDRAVTATSGDAAARRAEALGLPPPDGAAAESSAPPPSASSATCGDGVPLSPAGEGARGECSARDLPERSVGEPDAGPPVAPSMRVAKVALGVGHEHPGFSEHGQGLTREVAR